MPLDPIKDQSVGLFRRLPEETVRLPFQNFELGAGYALRQHFGLRHVITPDRIPLADNHQSRCFDIAETVVGDMPRGWRRARQSGKLYYPSLGALVASRRGDLE